MSKLASIEFIINDRINEKIVKEVIDALFDCGVRFYGGFDEKNDKYISSDVCNSAIISNKEDETEEIIGPPLDKGYLFNWDNVPGKDNEQLINFLENGAGIKWAKNTEIKKSDDGMVITVTNKEDKKYSVSIKIDEEKNNMYLNGSRWTTKYSLKEESDKVKVNDKCIKALANAEDMGYICMVHKDLDNSFDLVFTKDRSISIVIRNPVFSDEENETIISIIKCVYNAVHTVYGYGEGELEIKDGKEVPTSDIQKLDTPIAMKYIYSINIFGPKLVKKIGREKLLSAPSWRTEELEDGGILLVLGTRIFGSDDAVDHREVEKHLGFKE